MTHMTTEDRENLAEAFRLKAEETRRRRAAWQQAWSAPASLLTAQEVTTIWKELDQARQELAALYNQLEALAGHPLPPIELYYC